MQEAGRVGEAKELEMENVGEEKTVSLTFRGAARDYQPPGPPFGSRAATHPFVVAFFVSFFGRECSDNVENLRDCHCIFTAFSLPVFPIFQDNSTAEGDSSVDPRNPYRLSAMSHPNSRPLHAHGAVIQSSDGRGHVPSLKTAFSQPQMAVGAEIEGSREPLYMSSYLTCNAKLSLEHNLA